MKVRLGCIAYARSGDKGSDVNIGVIAYAKEGYAFLEEELTEKKVYSFFEQMGLHSVKRYLLPNLWALNFILKNVLEGGGSVSLRVDGQGKTLGQSLLEIPMEISEELLEKISR